MLWAWLAAVENGLDDVRGEIAEADEPCKIGWADALPLGECRKRYTVAADKSGVEPARLDQQFDESAWNRDPAPARVYDTDSMSRIR
jgi:hypothetical protein